MFLLNSCLDLFAAPHSREDPFSLGYGVNLPSSLTVNLPSALVYSTRPRVSVYGTGDGALMLIGVSRQYGYRRYRILLAENAYYRASAQDADLPAPLGTFALQPPIPSGGGRVTTA